MPKKKGKCKVPTQARKTPLQDVRVELHGLQVRTDLNGCTGVVTAYVTSTERCAVRLDALDQFGKDVVTVKPGNLASVLPPKPSTACIVNGTDSAQAAAYIGSTCLEPDPSIRSKFLFETTLPETGISMMLYDTTGQGIFIYKFLEDGSRSITIRDKTGHEEPEVYEFRELTELSELMQYFLCVSYHPDLKRLKQLLPRLIKKYPRHTFAIVRVNGIMITPLDWACKKGNLEIAEFLCKWLPTHNMVYEGAPVAWACYTNNVAVARMLVLHGADSTKTESCVFNSKPPLILAAENGSLQAMQWLVDEQCHSIAGTLDSFNSEKKGVLLSIKGCLREYGGNLETLSEQHRLCVSWATERGALGETERGLLRQLFPLRQYGGDAEAELAHIVQMSTSYGAPTSPIHRFQLAGQFNKRAKEVVARYSDMGCATAPHDADISLMFYKIALYHLDYNAEELAIISTTIVNFQGSARPLPIEETYLFKMCILRRMLHQYLEYEDWPAIVKAASMALQFANVLPSENPTGVTGGPVVLSELLFQRARAHFHIAQGDEPQDNVTYCEMNPEMRMRRAHSDVQEAMNYECLPGYISPAEPVNWVPGEIPLRHSRRAMHILLFKTKEALETIGRLTGSASAWLAAGTWLKQDLTRPIYELHGDPAEYGILTEPSWD